MDPFATFGAPMLGAVFQLLVTTGWDALKAWKSGRKDELVSVPPETSVLRGQIGPLRMRSDGGSMWEVSKELEFLTENYRDLERLSPRDPELTASLLRLRQYLEDLFGQRITFQNEDDRPESGTRLGAEQEIVSPMDSTITAAKKRLPSDGVIRQRITYAYRTEITGFDGGDQS